MNKSNKVLFTDKKAFIKEIKRRKYRDSVIAATNLAFDFFGVFFGKKEMNNSGNS